VVVAALSYFGTPKSSRAKFLSGARGMVGRSNDLAHEPSLHQNITRRLGSDDRPCLPALEPI
jgi:hypothetical protein